MSLYCNTFYYDEPPGSVLRVNDLWREPSYAAVSHDG